MELKKDPRCYTDVCIDGKWYHYDHCSTHVYMLMGAPPPACSLPMNPAAKRSWWRCSASTPNADCPRAIGGIVPAARLVQPALRPRIFLPISSKAVAAA